MRTPWLGIAVGAALGLLDGLSAWFYPEARPMMVPVVLGSTIKGILTGLAAGLVARWRRSVAVGLLAGMAIGFVLSAVAAMGQPDHYWAIVMPGMLIGALVGFVTQRYPSSLDARARRTLNIGLLAVACFPAVASARQAPPDAFASIAGLVGRWTGTSEGQPGNGTVEREYERVFNARFIRVRSRSTYPPQEKNPKGEAHQDEGWFSFDRARQRIVFRQFHVEGFVNQYVEDVASAPHSVVFTSEAIENIPAGYRARETYVVHGPDEVEEVFELAEPGKPFTVYSRTRLKRVK